MPFEISPPKTFKKDWKIKIREKEKCEPPHVTIIKGMDSWRYSLRDGKFLDRIPPPRDVPKEIVKLIQQKIVLLKRKWDEKYPENKCQTAPPASVPKKTKAKAKPKKIRKRK